MRFRPRSGVPYEIADVIMKPGKPYGMEATIASGYARTVLALQRYHQQRGPDAALAALRGGLGPHDRREPQRCPLRHRRRATANEGAAQRPRHQRLVGPQPQGRSGGRGGGATVGRKPADRRFGQTSPQSAGRMARLGPAAVRSPRPAGVATAAFRPPPRRRYRDLSGPHPGVSVRFWPPSPRNRQSPGFAAISMKMSSCGSGLGGGPVS